MTGIRRLRALVVVSALWGFLAALLYVTAGWVGSLRGPVQPGLREYLMVFGLAWLAGTVTGAIMGLALMAIARGRPLQQLRRWEPFLAGFAAGAALVIGLIGVAGGLTAADLSMWGTTMVLATGIFGTITGTYTLLFAEIARRGGRSVSTGAGHSATLPPT